MAYPQAHYGDKFSYADYLTWPDNERWEIIDGVPYAMSPAPGSKHQQIQAGLIAQLYVQLKGRQCQVYGAPFDVRLCENKDQQDDEVESVVQPDVVVVCDRNKVDERGCNGAPDVVLEILSPTTSKYDLSDKRYLYERHGVEELWFIHPIDKTAMIFYLQKNGRYESPVVYGSDATVSLKSVSEVKIDLGSVFDEG
ncbi:MAG: Uma2 family endonuclease [Desulfuromonadales bacterium]